MSHMIFSEKKSYHDGYRHDKLHLKGGYAIQKDSCSYHYSRLCWILLLKKAERLLKT